MQGAEVLIRATWLHSHFPDHNHTSVHSSISELEMQVPLMHNRFLQCKTQMSLEEKKKVRAKFPRVVNGHGSSEINQTLFKNLL